MYNEEIARLNFEDFLWIIFALISLMNVYGDYLDKEYIKTNNRKSLDESNKVFQLTLIVALFIYIYFFSRNYQAYNKANLAEKKLYSIKLLGSCFLIAGAICLIYFQFNQENFIGGPSL